MLLVKIFHSGCNLKTPVDAELEREHARMVFQPQIQRTARTKLERQPVIRIAIADKPHHTVAK